LAVSVTDHTSRNRFAKVENPTVLPQWQAGIDSGVLRAVLQSSRFIDRGVADLFLVPSSTSFPPSSSEFSSSLLTIALSIVKYLCRGGGPFSFTFFLPLLVTSVLYSPVVFL